MGGFLGLNIVYTYAASGEVTQLPIDVAWACTNLWSGIGILMGPFFSGLSQHSPFYYLISQPLTIYSVCAVTSVVLTSRAARVVLFSVASVCLFVCLSSSRITLEPLEISS